MLEGMGQSDGGGGATTGAEARFDFGNALRGAEAPLFHVTTCLREDPRM